ncbi:MAG TPA: CDP-diacylglycerol--serine O-phosphatidyltransferase [Rubricoccaceae bacterium]|nr:CDP-diacylglycerol--serine O-phosphatidyltransferase [Rubricoccaceae bacterium]
MEPPRLPRHRRRAGGYADGPPGPMLRQRRRVVRGRIPPGAVPSAFTLGNLLSGFFSLVYASQGNLDFAAWLIVVAGLFDLLDGMVARIAGSTSAFGVELDSLCDVVSFGAAPSFLIYQFGLNQMGLFGVLIASLPVLCGAVRLARFNTYADVGEKRDYFVGLPIPAQAGMIVAFVLTFEDDTWFTALERGRLSILIPLTVLLALLMVSPIRFLALPQPTRAAVKRYPRRFAAFAVALLLVLFLGEVGLLVSAVVYLGIGLFGAVRWAVRVATEDDEPPEPAAVPSPPPLPPPDV